MVKVEDRLIFTAVRPREVEKKQSLSPGIAHALRHLILQSDSVLIMPHGLQIRTASVLRWNVIGKPLGKTRKL